MREGIPLCKWDPTSTNQTQWPCAICAAKTTWRARDISVSWKFGLRSTVSRPNPHREKSIRVLLTKMCKMRSFSRFCRRRHRWISCSKRSTCSKPGCWSWGKNHWSSKSLRISLRLQKRFSNNLDSSSNSRSNTTRSLLYPVWICWGQSNKISN